MQEIFTRRSVRQYTDREISQQDITQLLKAAMRAPSAINQQPWEFVVLRDKEVLNEIHTDKRFYPNRNTIENDQLVKKLRKTWVYTEKRDK